VHQSRLKLSTPFECSFSKRLEERYPVASLLRGHQNICFFIYLDVPCFQNFIPWFYIWRNIQHGMGNRIGFVSLWIKRNSLKSSNFTQKFILQQTGSGHLIIHHVVHWYCKWLVLSHVYYRLRYADPNPRFFRYLDIPLSESLRGPKSSHLSAYVPLSAVETAASDAKSYAPILLVYI